MQFAIARLDLVSLIGKIQSVVPSHPSLPILSNILMEVKEGKLTVTATDLIISIQASIDVEQFQEGSITLPARKFFQLTRELTAARIEISSLSNEIARIKAGSSDFKIQGLNKSEFPLFPEISSSTKIKLKPNILKEMLTRASFCVARDESRQVFTGLLLSYHNHQMITMGANGKRLAKITSFIEHPSQEHLTSIIPLKTVDELVKILDTDEEVCELSLMSNRIALNVGSTVIISQLISGQYPDLNPIIPQNTPINLKLDREILMSMLRQICLFTNEHKSSAKFTFTPNILSLSAASGEIGEGVVSMDTDYSGDKFEISFNPQNFLDILKHIKDESFFFGLTDPYNPGLIKDSSQSLFIIMPMRLDG